MRRGKLITLEGPEGAGKSTHARLLVGWLKRQGCRVLQTREPGGTAVGQRLRNLLLDSKKAGLDPFVELCLYEASRAVLVSQVIRPALKAGKVVVLDRFYDSTWVYQGWAGRMDLRLVERLSRAATAGIQPDCTILLDLPVRQGLSRVRRPNRFEAKPLEFHQRVRQGYRALARRQRRRFQRVRADRPVGKVQEEIRRIVFHAIC